MQGSLSIEAVSYTHLFMDFGRRSGLEDVDNFAQVLSAAKRSGGELVERCV